MIANPRALLKKAKQLEELNAANKDLRLFNIRQLLRDYITKQIQKNGSLIPRGTQDDDLIEFMKDSKDIGQVLRNFNIDVKTPTINIKAIEEFIKAKVRSAKTNSVRVLWENYLEALKKKADKNGNLHADAVSSAHADVLGNRDAHLDRVNEHHVTGIPAAIRSDDNIEQQHVELPDFEQSGDVGRSNIDELISNAQRSGQSTDSLMVLSRILNSDRIDQESRENIQDSLHGLDQLQRNLLGQSEAREGQARAILDDESVDTLRLLNANFRADIDQQRLNEDPVLIAQAQRSINLQAAASVIQRLGRAGMSRANTEKLKAATTLQKVFRGNKGRERSSETKEAANEEQEFAANIIQKVFRGISSRVQLSKEQKENAQLLLEEATKHSETTTQFMDVGGAPSEMTAVEDVGKMPTFNIENAESITSQLSGILTPKGQSTIATVNSLTFDDDEIKLLNELVNKTTPMDSDEIKEYNAMVTGGSTAQIRSFILFLKHKLTIPASETIGKIKSPSLGQINEFVKNKKDGLAALKEILRSYNPSTDKQQESSAAAAASSSSGKGMLNNLDDAVDRLEILIGSRGAGNTNRKIKEEMNDLADFLLKNKKISKSEHKVIMK